MWECSLTTVTIFQHLQQDEGRGGGGGEAGMPFLALLLIIGRACRRSYVPGLQLNLGQMAGQIVIHTSYLGQQANAGRMQARRYRRSWIS